MGNDQTPNKNKPSKDKDLFNPFPGLRPFSSDESHLFFGRKGQSEEVLSNLTSRRFVAVMGASGSGKSSLIFCGLIPMLTARSPWQIVNLRPGNSPISNLADALAESFHGEKEAEKNKAKETFLKHLKTGPEGLVNTVKEMRDGQDKNYLILIDQFEELFRYKKGLEDQASYSESVNFVKLLVEAVRQQTEPVYVVLTMRSDFIGDCAQFQDLTELINNSNYLVPQMTRSDFKDAIIGPVKVGRAEIDEDLVQKLLEDVGDNPDQLPILQHAMMRTWDYWSQFKDLGRSIGLGDYKAIGSMEKALSEHANETFDELDQEGKEICESVFKTLTEKGADTRGIRHPTRLDHLASIARVTPEKVMAVVDRFRAIGRSFLVPSSKLAISSESIIDLSHESIMRVWDRLMVWVEEEAQAVNMYQRLADAAEMYQEGKTGLWRPPDLQLALNWRKKQQPTLTWAERYNPAFERAMVYLETSEKEHIAEEENKIRMQRRALRRTRITALVLGIAAIISLGFMLFAVQQRTEADRQRDLAEERRIEAENNREEAERNAEEARIQSLLAIANADTAVMRQLEADSAKLVALANEEEAKRQEQMAQQNEARAVYQEGVAKAQADTATMQKTAAETARDEAFKRRMLSIAQSMSVKSLQIDDDPDLKGLLAYQAYKFHNQYQGEKHDRDIYAGLYSASLDILGNENFVLEGHEKGVTSIAMAGSRIFTAGKDGKVLEWNLNDLTKRSKTLIENGFINNILATSADGKWLACGTDFEGVQVWDLTKNITRPSVYKIGNGKINSLTFLSDDKLLVAERSNNLFELDLQSGEFEQIFTAESVIRSLAATNDGQIIAGGTLNGKILIWQAGGWDNPVVLFEEAGNSVDALVFDNKGNRLVSGDEANNIKIWNIRSGTLIESLRGPTGRIYDLVFSLDDTYFASASHDNRVQVWLTRDWNIQPLVINVNDEVTDAVYAVAFSSTGEEIITGSAGLKEENKVLLSIRPTAAEAFIPEMCPNLNRNMTLSEWNIYVGEDIEYEHTCETISTVQK